MEKNTKVWATVGGTFFKDGQASVVPQRLPAIFVDRSNPNTDWCRVIFWTTEAEEQSGARGQRCTVRFSQLERRDA